MKLARRRVVLLSMVAMGAGCSAEEVVSGSSEELVCSPTTLVDHGDPSLGFGTLVLSELGAFNQVGDDFSLAVASTLQTIDWWGTGEGADFAVRIFAMTAGTPATTPLYEANLGVVPGTPEEHGGIEIDHYTASLPPA